MIQGYKMGFLIKSIITRLSVLSKMVLQRVKYL